MGLAAAITIIFRVRFQPRFGSISTGIRRVASPTCLPSLRTTGSPSSWSTASRPSGGAANRSTTCAWAGKRASMDCRSRSTGHRQACACGSANFRSSATRDGRSTFSKSSPICSKAGWRARARRIEQARTFVSNSTRALSTTPCFLKTPEKPSGSMPIPMVFPCPHASRMAGPSFSRVA